MPDGAVNNVTVIGYVENAIFGDNLGTINQGRENARPLAAAENFQHVPIGKQGLIQILQPIPDASHTRDREISPPNSACFPGTRKDVIQTIVSWGNSSLLFNTHILWLYGYVGCGKSAIALAIALIFKKSNRLVGSFFFFQNTGDRSRMTKFATTLACQLAAAIPEAAPFIEKAVEAEPGLLGSSLVSQLRRLVYEPFKAAAKRGRLLRTFLLKGPFLIVIDGLDECEDRRDVEAFIDDMLEFFKENPFVPLRFLITSRVEQHIQGCLENDQVRLENLVNHCSRDDIDTFIGICFEAEKRRNPVIKAYIREHGDWPTKADKDQLVDHIGGSFIFASSLFKYIVDPTTNESTPMNPTNDESPTPMNRLPHTLRMNPGLDTLYAQTLARSQHLPHFPDIISTLALLFEPLSIVGLAELLGIKTFEVIGVLVNLQAIIHIPGTDELPVTFCHTSLRDFLTTESRSGCFFASPFFHLHILYRCFILGDEQRSGTAVASYGTRRCKEHIERFIHLLPSVPGPFPRFPQTLDALYAHIFAQSQNLPHFSDIISTIAFLIEPLPIAGIAELLGIEAIEVSQVLANLRAIIPSTDELPVTLCHTSLRDFLTTESRSGRFFTPSSFHLHLLHRCSILREGPRSGTPAALYSIDYFESHIERLISFTPSAQRLVRPFPQTLDDCYAQILTQSRDLPHISDIISTIAFLFKPLPIVGIAELLDIKAVEVVVQVLDNLRAIIRIPGTDELPVTFCHSSLRDFLTTKSRSGAFFVSPSYHLELSYRWYTLNLEHLLANRKLSRVVGFEAQAHSIRFLTAISEQDILVELEQFTHASSQALPYLHCFAFTLLSCEMLQHSNRVFPGHVLETLTKCMEFLALALESDPVPAEWLHKTFQSLGFFGFVVIRDLTFIVRQEQATTLQHNLQRVEAAIRAKCPSSLPDILWDPDVDGLSISQWLGTWTAMEAYRLFKWMITHVQLQVSLEGPAVTSHFYLRMIRFNPEQGQMIIDATVIHVP